MYLWDVRVAGLDLGFVDLGFFSWGMNGLIISDGFCSYLMLLLSV